MKGLSCNATLEKLDLSDNDILDQDGLAILRYVKKQAETRDNALWMTGLRHPHSKKKASGTTHPILMDIMS